MVLLLQRENTEDVPQLYPNTENCLHWCHCNITLTDTDISIYILLITLFFKWGQNVG